MRTQARACSSFALGELAGALVTAIAIFSVSGLWSWLGHEVAVGMSLVLLSAAVIADASQLHVKVPHLARQVPQTIFFGRSLSLAAFGFGFEMGTGWMTHLTTYLPAALLAGLWIANPGIGLTLLTALAFALGRLLILVQELLSPSAATGSREATYLSQVKLLRPVVAGATTVVLGSALVTVAFNG